MNKKCVVTKALVEISITVIQSEADSILRLKDCIDQSFADACNLLQKCQVKVVLIGMEKSDHIGRKISAIFAYRHTILFCTPWRSAPWRSWHD